MHKEEINEAITTTKEALEPWWTEFIEHWNAKYPTTPLYDTESAKFYVRRAVKFVLTGSIDGNNPTMWPSRVSAPIVAPVVDAKAIAEEVTDRWFRNALPERARAQSTTRAMLRILIEDVIAPASTVAPQQAKHHKHCSSWTVNTSGERQLRDCVCECTHSMFQHIRPGEHYWYEDCAVDGCPCMKFAPASPAALRDEAGSDYAMEMRVGKGWMDHKEAAERIVARIADNDCLTCKHWTSDAVYAIAVELAAATTQPSTLARKAATDEIVKGWFWYLPERDQNRARMNIEQIIERCLSGDGGGQSK